MQPGDAVEVLNGRGGVAHCVVAEMDKRRVSLAVGEVRKVDRPARRLTLCLGQLNREKSMEEVIAGCVPLGVDRFLVFKGDHSERKPELNPKWARWARESCKQCGRAWLPDFETAGSFDAALEKTREETRLAALIGSERTTIPASVFEGEACVVMVGPEGGFSEREKELAISSGVEGVSLGPYVLRTALACASFAAVVRSGWRVQDAQGGREG